MNFILPFGAFPYDVFVSICDTDEEFLAATKLLVEKKKYKQFKKGEGLGLISGQARTWQLSTGQVMLRTVDALNTPKGVGILAHECSHAVDYVLDSVHTPYVDETKEVYAYHLGFMVENILEKWFSQDEK